MSNCIICDKKLGMLNTPMFGMGKTKNGDRICTNCNQSLAKRNSPFCNNISKYSTDEFLDGIKFKKMKEVQDKLNAINPKLLKMPEAFELPYILTENEVVERVEVGFLSEGASMLSSGFIVVTDSRVFVLDVNSSPTSSKMSMEDFPLDKITSISFERGLGKSKIKLVCSGNNTSINVMQGGEELSQYIRDKIKQPKTINQPVQTIYNDPIEQLKKLKNLFDSGIITADEFETKKTDLLSKI